MYVCTIYIYTGDFASGTVSRWVSDAIFLIERLITKSPVVLVGSGVGGWIGLLVAEKRPDLVVSEYVKSWHGAVIEETDRFLSC